jgi:hypothetical protein
VHSFTTLNITPLGGGYSELLVQSASVLSPPPGPGQYLNVVFEPGIPPAYAPIMQMQASDRLQVLVRTPTPVARHARIEARIEGDALVPDAARAHIVLVSAESALACAVFAASRLRLQAHSALTVFAQFKHPTPFKALPSQILMPACPSGVIAAVPLLDSWNIPSRLAGSPEQSGFYHGDATGLLAAWWQHLDKGEHTQVQILGFGDESFLRDLGNWCNSQRIPLRTAIIPP